MTLTFRHRCAVCLLVAAVGAIQPALRSAGRQAGEAATRGLTVESVAADSPAAKAGIVHGDVLVSWIAAPAPPLHVTEERGTFDSEFDRVNVEMEQGARSAITIAGRRGPDAFNAVLGPDAPFLPPDTPWGVTARPFLRPDLLRIYDEALALAKTDAQKAPGRWLDGARATAQDEPVLAAWFMVRAANAAVAAKAFTEASAAYASARETLARARPTEVAGIFHAEAGAYEQQGDLNAAENAYYEAVTLRESAGRDTLRLVGTLVSLAQLTQRRGDTTAAEDVFQRAVALYDRLGPKRILAIDVALFQLGTLASNRGELEAADRYLTRLVSVIEPMAGTSAVAQNNLGAVLGNLGQIADRRGDLARAAALLRRSLALVEPSLPAGTAPALVQQRLGNTAVTLSALGSVERKLGDLENAEAHLSRALDIRQTNAPGSPVVAAILLELGSVTTARGEFGKAAERLNQAQVIYEKTNDVSIGTVAAAERLATLAEERGDLAGAEKLQTRTLELSRRLHTFARETMRAMNALGRLAARRNDHAGAAAWYLQAARQRDEFDRLSAKPWGFEQAIGPRGTLAWSEREQAVRSALERAEASDPNGLEVADHLLTLGVLLDARADYEAARALYQRSLAIRERLQPDSLTLAGTYANLAGLADRLGDLEAAERRLSQTLELRERLVPVSPDTAESYFQSGVFHARRRNNPVRAASYIDQGLELARRVDPGGPLEARLLDATTTFTSGRLNDDTVETHLQRRLDIWRRVAPGSPDEAWTLLALGKHDLKRGDGEAAERRFLEAVAIMERSASDHYVSRLLLEVALTYASRGNNLAATDVWARRALDASLRSGPDTHEVMESLRLLGFSATNRRDSDRAIEVLKQARAIAAKHSDRLLLAAQISANLGAVYTVQATDRATDADFVRSKMRDAEPEFFRSLTTLSRSPRDGNTALNTAGALQGLAEIAYTRKDFAAAERYLARALALWRQYAPNSQGEASALVALAAIARERGDLEKAVPLYLRAIALNRRNPRRDIVMALQRLGAIAQEQGRLEDAKAHYLESLEDTEAFRQTVGGGDESRAGVEALYVSVYRNAIDGFLAMKQPDQAFQILERSRAHSLLTMITERSVNLNADLPSDLARARQRTNAEYDETQARLAGSSGAVDAAETDRLVARLRELRDQRDVIATRVRAASPRLAALQYPQPLDAPAVAAALDPGTVLLSYVVEKERTLLFVVEPTGRALATVTIPLGETELRNRVAAWLGLLRRARGTSERPAEALLDQAARLFDDLVKPASTAIARSRRVVIVPDGPLHELPFSALVRRTPGARAFSYFIEWKPVSVVASATVYAELQRSRPRSADPASATLVAFGAPVYPTGDAPRVARVNEDPEEAVLRRRGMTLAPLPATRTEVETIGQAFGPRAQVYVGADATEERAKTAAVSARYLHFAVHGLLDERFPLNSALALSVRPEPKPGEANGLLQAWEILEQMRINADLVVLSACDTALGAEAGGEGLVGLVRAFQYAGARSVLASLWSVGDDSTAALMTRVYRHLKAGKTKDEALRAAQIDLIRSGYPHPFQWAAFTLIGDWR